MANPALTTVHSSSASLLRGDTRRAAICVIIFCTIATAINTALYLWQLFDDAFFEFYQNDVKKEDDTGEGLTALQLAYYPGVITGVLIGLLLLTCAVTAIRSGNKHMLKVFGCWSCGCSVISIWLAAEALFLQCDTDLFPSELYCQIPWLAELAYGVLLSAAFMSTLKLMQISDAQTFSAQILTVRASQHMSGGQAPAVSTTTTTPQAYHVQQGSSHVPAYPAPAQVNGEAVHVQIPTQIQEAQPVQVQQGQIPAVSNQTYVQVAYPVNTNSSIPEARVVVESEAHEISDGLPSSAASTTQITRV